MQFEVIELYKLRLRTKSSKSIRTSRLPDDERATFCLKFFLKKLAVFYYLQNTISRESGVVMGELFTRLPSN